jgi:hypothetical protein
MAALPALVMASTANPMNMQQAPDHRKGALLCAEIQALIAVMRQNSKWAMVPGYGYGEEELPEDPLLEEFKILRRKVRAMPLPRFPPPPSPVGQLRRRTRRYVHNWRLLPHARDSSVRPYTRGSHILSPKRAQRTNHGERARRLVCIRPTSM